jgi:hypothetical protein
MNAIDAYEIAILSEERPMNDISFIEHVISSVEEFCHPKGRKTHERGLKVHPVHGQIHTTKEVRKLLLGFRVKRMKRPFYVRNWHLLRLFSFERLLSLRRESSADLLFRCSKRLFRNGDAGCRHADRTAEKSSSEPGKLIVVLLHNRDR